MLATEIPDALPALAYNVAQNCSRIRDFAASSAAHAGEGGAQPPAIHAASLPWSLQPPSQGLPLLPPFDVIVAADTLYHTESHALLAATIRNCAAAASIVLLAFPLRTGKVCTVPARGSPDHAACSRASKQWLTHPTPTSQSASSGEYACTHVVLAGARLLGAGARLFRRETPPN